MTDRAQITSNDLQPAGGPDTSPTPAPQFLLVFSSPASVPHYMVPSSTGPSVADMMKLAGDISTIESKAKLLKTQTCKRSNRHTEDLNWLQRQIGGVDARIDDIFARQDVLEQRYNETSSRIGHLEAQVARLSRVPGPAPPEGESVLSSSSYQSPQRGTAPSEFIQTSQSGSNLDRGCFKSSSPGGSGEFKPTMNTVHKMIVYLRSNRVTNYNYQRYYSSPVKKP